MKAITVPTNDFNDTFGVVQDKSMNVYAWLLGGESKATEAIQLGILGDIGNETTINEVRVLLSYMVQPNAVA